MPYESRWTLEYKIPHLKQRYNWDCGVTCVMMLLPQQEREDLFTNLEDICREEGFDCSTWTIDLCYLLKRYGLLHTMYTTMIGVNESYKRLGYYKSIIDKDKERVRKRFSTAAQDGIEVISECLGTDKVLEHVIAQGPAILLVDAGLLSCDLCKRNKLAAEFRRWFGGPYRGHYVIVVGQSRDRVLFRDPSSAAPVCACPLSRLDEARRASGTDYDTILINNKYLT